MLRLLAHLELLAVTASPPGLPKPKAKPVPKTILLGNFGTGSSLGLGLGSVKTDDMMTGLVDFDLKGCLPLGLLGSTCSHGNLFNTLVGLPVAPLETFALDGPTVSRHVTLKKVEDLNLSVRTEFHDVYLQEQLASAVWQDREPWLLFDSGAAAHCCPKDFAPEWPLLPLTGRASGQPLLIYGGKLAQFEPDGCTCWLHSMSVTFHMLCAP